MGCDSDGAGRERGSVCFAHAPLVFLRGLIRRIGKGTKRHIVYFRAILFYKIYFLFCCFYDIFFPRVLCIVYICIRRPLWQRGVRLTPIAEAVVCPKQITARRNPRGTPGAGLTIQASSGADLVSLTLASIPNEIQIMKLNSKTKVFFQTILDNNYLCTHRVDKSLCIITHPRSWRLILLL